MAGNLRRPSSNPVNESVQRLVMDSIPGVSTKKGSQRVSYTLTKSFVHARVAGTIEEEARLGEVQRDLQISGDIKIVSQVSVLI